MQTYYTISHYHQGELKQWMSTGKNFPSSAKFDTIGEALGYLVCGLKKKDDYYERTGIHASDTDDQYIISEHSTPYPNKQMKRVRMMLIYESGEITKLY